MTDSPVPSGLDPTRGDVDDPLSADRRVLVIGAASMVVLILIGAVSAALFTRSACARIGPDPVLPRAAGDDLDAVLAEALPDLFDDERAALVASFEGELSRRFGPVVGAADVTGARALAPVGSPAEGLVAALGGTTTLLAPDGTLRATAEVGSGVVVGDGAALYSLALTNPGTGQTDAFVPLDLELGGGDCVDTATVATPFAFLLAAGDGQIAFLRVEEDGDFPELELRDAVQGQVWSTPLDIPEIPPGVSGERLDAAMGLELVVVGRRTTTDDQSPVLSAFARASGEARWSVDLETIEAAAPAGDGPVWPDVVAVGDDTILVGLARGDARGPGTLAAFAVADGGLRWVADVPQLTPVAAAFPDDGSVVVLTDTAGDATAQRLDLDDGSPIGSGAIEVEGGFAGTGGAVAIVGGEAVAAAGAGLLFVGDDEIAAVGPSAGAAAVVDLVVVGDTTVVLIVSDDGAVGVSFSAP